MNRYASRKFLVALFVLIAATWSLFEFLITSGDYVKIVIAVVGLYSAGNVMQKATAKDGDQS